MAEVLRAKDEELPVSFYAKRCTLPVSFYANIKGEYIHFHSAHLLQMIEFRAVCLENQIGQLVLMIV